MSAPRVLPSVTSAGWIHVMVQETNRCGGTIQSAWRESEQADDELRLTFDYISDCEYDYNGQILPAGSRITVDGKILVHSTVHQKKKHDPVLPGH